MIKKIKASAPGKLMLFGEHAVIYNRPCLVTAVNKRISVEVSENNKNEIFVNAPDVGISKYRCQLCNLGKRKKMPKGLRFVEQGLINFYKEYGIKKAVKIKTKSEFSSKFGFGSSSAVTVALLMTLAKLWKIRIGKQKLFSLAYKTVLDVQGVGSGFDLATAIWGGTVYFVTGGKVILPIKTKKWPLIIGYTGIKADTPTLVRKVNHLYEKYPKIVNQIFDNMAQITKKAKREAKKQNYKILGELMNINQGLLDSLGVGIDRLSRLNSAARNAGAYGAKLSGAGGGDCMIALVRNLANIKLKAKIKTRNNFPKGIGVASSASGFAALTLAASGAVNLTPSKRKLSILARLGSGSACRSIPNGIVEWRKGKDSNSSYSYSLYSPNYWSLIDIVVVVDAKEKKISSTKGHGLAKKSPFFKARIDGLEQKLTAIKKAMKNKNFKKFGEILEKEALNMHAVMMTSTPSLLYWQGKTIEIIQAIKSWRKEGLKSYFTLDAGPTVHVICLKKNLSSVKRKLSQISGIKMLVVNKATRGAHFLNKHLF